MTINPYRVKFGQKLLDRDRFARMNMCEWFMRKIKDDPCFTEKILWSDEATFTINGKFNKQNFR